MCLEARAGQANRGFIEPADFIEIANEPQKRFCRLVFLYAVCLVGYPFRPSVPLSGKAQALLNLPKPRRHHLHELQLLSIRRQSGRLIALLRAVAAELGMIAAL